MMADTIGLGSWIVEHWDALGAAAFLIGGFIFAWRRQVWRALGCFIGCVGVFVIGGLQ